MSAQPPPLPSQPVIPHLLSLKVLRTAKPSLAIDPSTPSFPPSFSGEAIENLLSKSTSTTASEFNVTNQLQLPSTFGTIYLGETFSSLLNMCNDSNVTALSPTLKAEMHTSGATGTTGGGQKHLLLTLNLGEGGLNPGQISGGMVQHEIKELGMHALVVTVSYGVKEGNKVITRSFRKIFQFSTANPLSVRTKAHSPHPSTATSNLSSIESDKVFLEVQVQNQGQHGMYFERMIFEPTPSFTSVDVNHLSSPILSTSSNSTTSSIVYNSTPPSLFSSPSSSLLPPNAIRQYLYILSPTSTSLPPLPGSSQHLGRLDILWRTPNGETGKLQTSMLGRRAPEKSGSIGMDLAVSTTTGGKGSPPVPVKELILDPHRVDSPPQLPSTPLIRTPDDSNLTFDLTVLSITPTKINREEIFEINFNLQVLDRSSSSVNLNSTLPATTTTRKLKIIAQYVKWTTSESFHRQAIPTPIPTSNGLILPRPIRIISSPLPLVMASTGGEVVKAAQGGGTTPSLEIVKVGTTSIALSDFIFDHSLSPSRPNITSETIPSSGVPSAGGGGGIKKLSQTFSMKFLATSSSSESNVGGGLMKVGGIRILLVSSEWGNGSEGVEKGNEREGEGGEVEGGEGEGERRAKVVLELGAVAEVWIGGGTGGGE